MQQLSEGQLSAEPIQGLWGLGRRIGFGGPPRSGDLEAPLLVDEALQFTKRRDTGGHGIGGVRYRRGRRGRHPVQLGGQPAARFVAGTHAPTGTVNQAPPTVSAVTSIATNAAIPSMARTVSCFCDGASRWGANTTGMTPSTTEPITSTDRGPRARPRSRSRLPADLLGPMLATTTDTAGGSAPARTAGYTADIPRSSASTM